jgi:5'-nucleotidase
VGDLEAVRAELAKQARVVVCAPEINQSATSHSLSLHRILRVRKVEAGVFAIDGTPADCVRVGLHRLVPDAAWVLAGINCGGNLGADVWHSGTVAAVREAVLHGLPGVALSQYRRRGEAFDWGRAARWVARVLGDLLGRDCPPGTFWNVNLPHPGPDAPEPEVVFCPLDPNPLPLTFRRDGDCYAYCGDYHGRRRHPGSDVDVCFGGNIAVTRLKLF